ncbi:hypothetical protein HPP92_024424, partial [Vanilla planifolia]
VLLRLSPISRALKRRGSIRPPGTQNNLLNDVSLFLPVKSFGLVFGRSGSGKTTLLQILAGLSTPTSGSICILQYADDGTPTSSPEPLLPERVGIVFQFPERYFLADTILEELTFGWPKEKADFLAKEQLALELPPKGIADPLAPVDGHAQRPISSQLQASVEIITIEVQIGLENKVSTLKRAA